MAVDVTYVEEAGVVEMVFHALRRRRRSTTP
jgi:hypothetical protein